MSSFLIIMKKFSAFILLSILILACNKTTNNDYLLKLLDQKKTNIDFQNIISDDINHNIINYLYYYNGGGVAVGDINNDDLPDVYFVSNKGENKLYLNQGNLIFKDITNTAGISGNSDWNTGVTMVDINNDGFLDIYVCAVSGILDFKGKNELFINNGDNTFSEKAKDYGLDYKGLSTQAYFFDYDKDDDLDAYIVNHAVHTKNSHGPSLIRQKRVQLTGDVLLKNDNNLYSDVSENAHIYGGANGYGLSASIADFNNDGWDDIYVCNDFHEDDYYYLNNGDGTFKESLGNSFQTISRFSMGSDAGDLNNDGHQDIITLDMLPFDEKVLKESEGDVSYNIQNQLLSLGYKKQYSRNMLQLNSNAEFFNEVGLFNNIASSDWSWGPLIADFNQDGKQDIFISNGVYKRPNNLDFMRYIASTFKNQKSKTDENWLLNSLKEMPSGKVPNQIYEGTFKKFKNRSGTWITDKATLSNGASYADLDNDGDLDIIVNNINDYAHIYENTTDINANYLKVKLNYKEKNINGIGAKVSVYSNGNKQLKQLFASRGFISSVDINLHFGLGSKTSIDSIVVIWPNNTVQKILNPSINNQTIINYNNTSPDYYYEDSKKNNKTFTPTNLINFKHFEDTYNDFDFEKLIPYKVSTSGPAIAIGDIDKNGYDDLFFGNGSGFKASLYLNNGNSFIKKQDSVIEKDSLFEDIDATFFDADNDNDLDLYIASGINSKRDTNYELDRLYINDGYGNFRRSYTFPNNYLNTAVVKAYDYDQDGDTDLFIGNRSKIQDYRQPIASYILINDGKGNFIKDNKINIKSRVTDAIWKDINDDNLKDLLISTEWDKPIVFLNSAKGFKQVDLPNSLFGLWQTVDTYDVDNDGDEDIVLGNWGLNTKFQPTEEDPLLMYHSDFNSDGVNEAILAYKVNNNYYPVNSKDELALQINSISRRFVKYKDFAFKPIDEVMTKEALSVAKNYLANNLSSGYIINNNGVFKKFKPFPKDLQYSPITSFLSDSFTTKDSKELLVAGNFYDLNTYHGSFSSLSGFIINNKIKMSFQNVNDFGLELHNKQIRALKSVKLKDFKLLIAVPNNDLIKFYKYQ